jgi:hypothetical protein
MLWNGHDFTFFHSFLHGPPSMLKRLCIADPRKPS